MGFYRPLSVYIPLCYFRHGYFEQDSTLVVLLRNSMSIDGRAGRTFLGHLEDLTGGRGLHTHHNYTVFTVFGRFINV